MKKRKVQVVIVYNAEGNSQQILLLKTNIRRQSFWQNVTGGVDDNETFKKAALREAIEETGIFEKEITSLIETDLSFSFHDQWKNDVEEKVFVLFTSKKWDVKIDSDEHDDYKWINIKDLNSELVKFETNYQAMLEAKKLIREITI